MSPVAQSETSIGKQQNLRSELRSLTSGRAFYEVARNLVSLTGKDRTRWLNGMVSNNIRDLSDGHGVYAFVLNPQGQIQGDLYAFNRGESLTLEIDRAQTTLLPQLRRYIIMDKVEVQELGESVAIIGLAGTEVQKTLETAGFTSPATTLQIAELTWKGIPITVVRGDNPCVPNYELWVPADAYNRLWASLLEAGAQEIHDTALEALRILCGIPQIGIDIRERTLPQETAQDRALNFNKGCYIGQEIVERIRARGSVHRGLTGFEVTGPLPASGTAIQVEGKDAGLITSSVTIPTGEGDHSIALGFLRKEHVSAEAVFEVSGAKLRPAALPFSNLIHQI